VLGAARPESLSTDLNVVGGDCFGRSIRGFHPIPVGGFNDRSFQNGAVLHYQLVAQAADADRRSRAINQPNKCFDRIEKPQQILQSLKALCTLSTGIARMNYSPGGKAAGPGLDNPAAVSLLGGGMGPGHGNWS